MKDIRKLTVISIAVALAIVLDYMKSFLPFLNMPFGGSVNIALIPIVLISYIYSYKEGMLSGFLWWGISTLLGLNNWFIGIGQYLCDYILPSIIPGMASILGIRYKNNVLLNQTTGILFAFMMRSMVLVFSGAYFWPEDGAALSHASWIYSFGYNFPYNLATAMLLILVVPILVKRIRHIVIR